MLNQLLDKYAPVEKRQSGEQSRVQMTWNNQLKTVADMINPNVGTFESYDTSKESPKMKGVLLLSPDNRKMNLMTRSIWSPSSGEWEPVENDEIVNIDANANRFSFDTDQDGSLAPHRHILGGGGMGRFQGKVMT